MPMQLAAMDQPVSVCHQWSITGSPSRRSDQASVSGSQRSPARKRARSFDRSCSRAIAPSGSTRLIARIAVGAVNITCTPWSAITRQKAPASGVPTGLPSYITVVQPCSSGP